MGRDSIREVVVPLLNSNGGDPMSHWLHARCPTCGAGLAGRYASQAAQTSRALARLSC